MRHNSLKEMGLPATIMINQYIYQKKNPPKKTIELKWKQKWYMEKAINLKDYEWLNIILLKFY